jgi:hypothetical protein
MTTHERDGKVTSDRFTSSPWGFRYYPLGCNVSSRSDSARVTSVVRARIPTGINA